MSRMLFFALAVALLPSAPADAERTRFYSLEGFGTWLDGNPESTVVTEDGSIGLPMLARERFADAATSFSAATVRGDDVLAARVEDAQVVAIDRAGRSTDVV